MSLFKNDVGRPSNEILKKRRNIKILIIVLAVLAVAGLSYFTYSYVSRNSVSGESKNISTSDAVFYIAGKNAGFIVNNKYYSKGKYISLGSKITMSTVKDNVGSSVVYVASSGKTAINIKGTFGREFTKKVNGANSTMILQSFNSSGKVVSSKIVKITKSSVVGNLTISSNVRSIKVSLMQQTVSGVKQVYTKTINTSTLPTVSETLVDSARKTSNGVYAVEKNGDNRVKFNINTTSGHTMYYSVFTYKSHSLTSANVEKKNTTCASFSKSTTTPTYSVNVNNMKAISIKVYGDINTCRSDSGSKANSKTSKPILTATSVKYSPKYTITNSAGYNVIVKYSRSGIGKNIGTQKGPNCFMYALKYGAYILGKSSYTKNSTVSSIYGATSHYAKSEKEIYDAIVYNIDRGKPVVIHVSNSQSEHYVTVVGYKQDLKGNVDSFDDIWIIDPYPAGGESCKNKKDVSSTPKNCFVTIDGVSSVMWEGKASDRSNTTKELRSDKRYLVW